ncbi:A24 family peptidase [Candidatus Contubernalis alkaliaceticus]|uniref:A24 family peptidase n=1 Tax=Candidatus Contubernalis alkaliaceticus TaxID=338645 RepID=UPI001F4C473F|nr:prepilin peptidase [Candidatus Contubernalis alkalaceticus]UNC93457.1 prepilin peptidase [Candidatus Contubernalis alkalaceticus]
MNFNINDYILIILIVLSLYFDLTQKKIPNFLTVPAVIWGLLYNTILNPFQGFVFSFSGLLVGIAVFLIPFMLGGMGGGDVKLMGAIGALKGMHFVLSSAVLTALFGGLIAVVILIVKGQLLSTLKRIILPVLKPLVSLVALRFRSPQLNEYYAGLSAEKEIKTADSLYFPYGVAIGLGTLTALSGFFSLF